MMNTGNAITDALGHLEQAGFEEEKRIAMVKATLSLEQPVLESIEDLASKMDDRIDKLASKMDDRIDKLASKMDADIKGLRSDMDARFEKMESRFENMESNFAALRVEWSRRDTWLIIAMMSLAATIVGFLFRMQSLPAL